MPVYEYKCQNKECGHVIDLHCNSSRDEDNPERYLDECPGCKAMQTFKKIPSRPGAILGLPDTKN